MKYISKIIETTFVGIFIEIVLVGLALFTYITYKYFNPSPTNPISTEISQKIATGKKQIVLTEITDFNWDQVVILGPYTPHQDANEVLGFTWDAFEQYNEALMSEYKDVIIFIKNRKIIKTFIHPRTLGNFTDNSLRVALTPTQAVFEVIQPYKDSDWKTLQLKKTPPKKNNL